jgi:tetratricopeptide (TPR) repeat protein
MAGVALCVAWCTPRLAEALRGAGALSRATCVAAALLVTLSFARSLTFTHEKSLWEDVTAKSPSSFRGHTGVAHVLWKAGDLAGARASFDRALAIHPRYGHAFDGLARLLIEEGRLAGDLVLLDRAVAMNQELVALRPTDPFARMGASAAFLARGTVGRNAADFAESERLALSCLDVAEPKSLIFRAAAEAREAAGDVDGALALLDESDRCGLAREPTALARARTLAAAARFGEAEAVLREVLQASPFAPEAHAQLAWLCRRDGRDAEAVVHELLGPGGAPPQLRGTPAAAPGAGPNR